MCFSNFQIEKPDRFGFLRSPGACHAKEVVNNKGLERNLGAGETVRGGSVCVMRAQWIVFFSLSLVMTCVYVSAQELEKKPTTSKKESSLDWQLKDSLDDDLLKDLPVAPKKITKPAIDPVEPKDRKGDAKPSSGKPKSALDEKLRDQLGEGEDIDLRQPSDPLSKIGQSMRKVEVLIGQRDTSRSTQEMQRQIANDLDTLIKDLQKQQNKKSSGGKSSNSSQQSDSSGAGNKQPMEKPSSESTQRVEKSTVKTDSSAELQKLIKEVWGHLPARVREQMQNVTEEQFLPQYEKLIEEYYRRLAEQGAKLP